MALLQQVGTFTSPASTGNQTVSLDSGIWGGASPKVIIFWGTGAATADGFGVHHRHMFGVAISSTSRAVCAVSALDGQSSTTSTWRSHDNTKCVMSLLTTVIEAADFVSHGANQFTIDWTTVNASAIIYNFLALGGDDLTGVYLDEIIFATSTGDVAYTGVGFQPDALIGFSTGSTFAPPYTQATSSFCLGMSDGTETAGVAVYSADGAATSGSIHLFSEALLMESIGPALRARAEVKSLDADGYTLNWTHVIASEYGYVLCLKGPEVQLVRGQQPTTNTTANRAIEFTPKAALALTAMNIHPGWVESVPSVLATTYAYRGVNTFGINGGTIAAKASWSVAMWIYLRSYPASGTHRYFSQTGSVIDIGIDNTGKLRIYEGAWNTISTNAIPLSQWVHITVAYDGADLTVHIDGVADALSPFVGMGRAMTATGVTLGAYFGLGFDLMANFADFRIYDDALTADESLYLATGGVSGTDPTTANLDHQWLLDHNLLDSVGSNDGLISGEYKSNAKIGVGAWDANNNMAFAGAVDETGQTITDADRIQDSNEAIKHADHTQTVVGSCSISPSGDTLIETWTDTDGVEREHALLVFGSIALTALPSSCSIPIFSRRKIN